ncbi:uncharacterized protein FA14DRAFT_160229 [Meira miltonrushii]|uniref:Uncharacterized protein n=1 Tax=Meira miltonrushii TaxID=1280837 RepID=A0A316VBA2_9BASI|nr:uncharacterized protein FA14DRAFT_160229 [Meira miltonrushii]PWN34770.1 hypothetical protein FA14DRAFT_160229 [Meira miltonrushii]
MAADSFDGSEITRVVFPDGMNFHPEIVIEAANVPDEHQVAVYTCIKFLYTSYRTTVVDAFFKEYVFSLDNLANADPINAIVSAFADFVEEKCQDMEKDLIAVIEEEVKGIADFGGVNDSGMLIRPRSVQKRKDTNGPESTVKRKIRRLVAPSAASELEDEDDEATPISSPSPSSRLGSSSKRSLKLNRKTDRSTRPKPTPKKGKYFDSDLESDTGIENDRILTQAIDDIFSRVKNWHGTMCVGVRLLLKHWPHKLIKKELKKGAGPIVHELIESFHTGDSITVATVTELAKKAKFKDACTIMLAINWNDDYLSKLKKVCENDKIHAAFLTATANIDATVKALSENCLERQAESIPLYSEEGIRDNDFFPVLVWSPTDDVDFYKGNQALKTSKEVREAMSVLAKSVFIALCTKMNFSGSFHKELKNILPEAKALHGLNDTFGLEHAFSRNEPLPIVKSDANPRTAIVPTPKKTKQVAPASSPRKTSPKKGRKSGTIDYDSMLNDFINPDTGLRCDLQTYGAGGLRAIVRLSSKENIFMPLDKYKKDEKLSEGDFVFIKMVPEKSNSFTKDGKLKGAKVLIRKDEKGSSWFPFLFPFSEKGGALWIQKLLKEHFKD